MDADSDFHRLERGSVVIRWSPSGAMDRFVVLSGKSPFGYRAARFGDDNSIAIGVQIHGEWDMLTMEGTDGDEGFGYTYVYMLGPVFEHMELLP